MKLAHHKPLLVFFSKMILFIKYFPNKVIKKKSFALAISTHMPSRTHVVGIFFKITFNVDSADVFHIMV